MRQLTHQVTDDVTHQVINDVTHQVTDNVTHQVTDNVINQTTGGTTHDADDQVTHSATPDNENDGFELVAGLSAPRLEQCLLQANRHTEVGHRLLAFYLNDMQARGIHQFYGYGSSIQFAVERLDMHRRKAQMLVAVGSALLSLRWIDQAFARGDISWSKTRLLCRVATEDTEGEWLKKARELSCRELEWMVKASAPGERPSSRRGSAGLPKVKFHVHAELGAVDHELWEQAKAKLAQERGGVTVGDAELMAELSRILLSTRADGSIPGRKPVDDSLFRVVVNPEKQTVHTPQGQVPLSDGELEAAVSDGHHSVTKATRNRILSRDGHRCRCCHSARNLQVHHVRFVSQGGETRPENLLTLCSHCHARIHAGLLRVRGAPEGKVEFQDRKGRPLRGALPHRLLSAGSNPGRVDYWVRNRANRRIRNGAGQHPRNGAGQHLRNGAGQHPRNGAGRRLPRDHGRGSQDCRSQGLKGEQHHSPGVKPRSSDANTCSPS